MTPRDRRIWALERHLARLERRAKRLKLLSARASQIRLLTFLLGIGAAAVIGALSQILYAIPFMLLLFIPFAVSVRVHSQIKRAIRSNHAWHNIKSTHLAKAGLDWAKIPQRPSHRTASHPFEIHLDITGDRSLHQLLDTSASVGASQRLRDWLLTTTPDLPSILRRQALARELSPLSRFRDRLALTSELVQKRRSETHEGELISNWLSLQGSSITHIKLLLITILLTSLTLILLLLNTAGLIPPLWLISFSIYALLFALNQAKFSAMFNECSMIEGSLQRFRAVFHYLETQSFSDRPHLKNLLAPFKLPHSNPTRAFKKTGWIMSGASLQKNLLVWFAVNLFFPSDFYFYYRLQDLKKNLSKTLPTWLNLWFELEALCSLANYAYLNPECSWPEIIAESERPIFQSRELSHPLINPTVRICNDFAINQRGELAIITGSNMSGKSTFLRIVGVNLVLAYAGGPVLASYFKTAPFRLFACMRIDDSLADGISFFYAEVKRLKQLIDELEKNDSVSVFYLIDEIFRGTNNRERLIGSQSIIREILRHKAIGLLSTHDLELVHLADEFPLIQNYHFQEVVLSGQMRFDYKLRAGPCLTTNALKIMALEGLPVQLPADAQNRRC